jgi:hypothetical protein
MTLDNEDHREFLANAIRSASVQGTVEQLRPFVKAADELLEAIEHAAVIPATPEV